VSALVFTPAISKTEKSSRTAVVFFITKALQNDPNVPNVPNAPNDPNVQNDPNDPNVF
jgi:hypothetical protein